MPQDHHKIKTVQMPNDVFLPFVIEQLNEGHTATLPLRGRSMRPFLEDGRDKALLQLCDHPQVGDAVLVEISKGLFVLHRIIRVEGRQVTLRGDGNLSDEHCMLSDIRAKAVGFYRKGRQTLDRTDGRKWRLYSWWWTRLYPLRRYLLFIIYPHIPQRFK
nr:S24/S26 family peptidase [uncultured Prevotella sp.]